MRHFKAKKHRKSSLQTKIVVWSFFPTSIVLCVVALVTFFALTQTTEMSVLDQDRELVALNALQVSNGVSSYLTPMTTFSERLRALDFDNAQRLYNALMLAQYSFTFQETGPSMIILDASGKVKAVIPESLANLGDDWASFPTFEDISQSSLYGEPSSQPVVSNVIEAPDGQAAVVGSVPILSVGDHVFQGILAIILPLDSIAQLEPVERQNLESRVAIIVDGHGRVIYHTDPSYVGADFSAHEAVQYVIRGEHGAVRTRNLEGIPIASGYAPIPDTPWGLVTEISWQSVHKSSQGYRYTLLVLLLLAVVIPVFVIRVGAKKIIHPITNLMDAVDGVASGNFDQITTINTGDELEELAHQFNAMAAKLRDSYTVLEQKVDARTLELATLNAIATVVNRSLDLDTTLQATLHETLARLNADVGCIYLLSSEDGALLMHASYGMDQVWADDVRTLAPGEGISGQAVALQQTVATDVGNYSTPRLVPYLLEHGIQTMAATPIMSKGEVLGALFVATTASHFFLQEEQSLLFAIGQQIGVGIENARLYTQAQQELAERYRAQERLRWVSEERARRNRELLLLNRVIAATTSQLDPTAVLEAVCRELCQTFDVPQGAIAMLNENRDALTVFAEYQSNPDTPPSLGVVIPVDGNPSTQYVLENKAPLFILDALNDDRLTSAHEVLRQRGVKSLLLLPLIVRGEVIGTVGLDSLVEREFTQEEINLAANAIAAASQALEKARAEEELRDSEVRYRELFNRSPIGIFRSAPDNVILDANPAFLNLLGFESVEEMNLIGLENLYVDPADGEHLLESTRAGAVLDFETRLRHQNGQIIYVSIRAALTRDENERPAFLQGTLMDITERREAEMALRESRERLQLAIEGAGLGLWDLNLLTGEQVMNYDWWGYLGYTPGDAVTHFEDIAKLTHPDDRGMMADAFNDHLSGKESLYEVEFRVQTQSNTWVWMLFRGKIVAYDETGKPLRMAGISQNITARKQAEEALRESETRFKVAMEAAGVGLWDWNLLTNEMTIANYQKEGLDYCCLEEGSISVTGLEKQMHPDDRDKLYQALTDHLEGVQSLYEVEFRLPDTSGQWRWQLQRGKVVARDENELPLRMTGIYEDVTVRKQVEEDLRQAKEAAEAANRAKSVFLANMSHELRTPLNAILGFTQLMSRDQHITPAQRENLETIGRSGQHLLMLINDVLEMSKIEAGRTTLYEENFDLYRLCETLEDMFHLRATQKGLQLLFERTANVPQYIRADESKLRQVLINLLSNAIKFTEEGGVTLRIGAQEPGSVDADSLSVEQIMLHVEVEDTGVGISPEDMQALFDPFVQTASGQEAKEGTGLGLPISQQYVRLMCSEITCESEVGRGSLFRFDVQVTPTDAAQVQAEVEPRRVVGIEPGQQTTDGQPYRLLIAEDKWTNRQLLLRLLRPFGFELREAVNGQEAIEIWESWSPHLIWMDMRMPVMDGHEATQRIKATTKGQATVIIALTASAFEEDRRVILSEGCDDFVRKPFREAEIFEMLEKHLGICFIYQEMQPAAMQTSVALQEILTAQALKELPAAWLDALHQAALEADTERLLELANEARARNAPLADAIAHVTYEFRFDILLELTRPED